MSINLDNIDLIIFGDFGVLTNTPFKEGPDAPLRMLPGRAEYLAHLQEDRHKRGLALLLYAVTGDKGGVAWGIQSEAQAEEEVRWTAEQIGSTHYRVCFACPTTKVGYEHYKSPEMIARRKPRPPMFRELIEELHIDPAQLLIVDHYADSFSGASRVGAQWQAPGSFFANATEYIPASKQEVAHELALLSDDPDLFDIDAVLQAFEEQQDD